MEGILYSASGPDKNSGGENHFGLVNPTNLIAESEKEVGGGWCSLTGGQPRGRAA